ncbi:hypothetical protein NQ315_013369 [Exocentrus adspersus]|uniref:RNase H type-1 domain-containing protein n=1 Tax=Exocentrus adspersus TaxID=1586481 RepID=A0AAV8VS40_9CUCU|nr:hypothetical protein NQ315_013369 [Exocentrus adspersus]
MTQTCLCNELRNISSPRTRSMLVQECGDALESLARQKEVGLVWVPAHMGIPGNERADRLARLGSGEPPQRPEPILGISRGSINGALSRWAYRRLGMSFMRNALEKCREASENERSQLLALVRSLETKIAEQNINTQEDRWALQQASATLVARSAALEREVEYNRTINEREREQLKTLKSSLLAEQEKIIAQLTEEKLKLSAEKARVETSNKLINSYESEKIKAEAEIAIQTAKDLSEKINEERRYMARQKKEVETLKRQLADRERELQDKESNLEYLIDNTQRKINNERKIIDEAKKLENRYKERLQELQNQWLALTEREKKLNEEKVLLSKERLTLYTAMKQNKNCVLCKANDLPVRGNYYMEENFSSLKVVQDTNGLRMDLDTAEDKKYSEVSKEENILL